MRVVLDTNVLVSAILSADGPPRRLLNHARAGAYELCTSPVLLAELLDVLSRAKFASRMTRAGVTPIAIVLEVRRISLLVTPDRVPDVILDDPDDDHVLACAVVADAMLIVSGDKHLLGIGGNYCGIRIVSAGDAVAIVAPP